MYLISLLFQVIISILLLVFIITTSMGVYFHINNSTEPFEKSSKLNRKVEEQTSEDEQINEEVIYDKKVENGEILVIGTNSLDTNFTETLIKIEELEQTNGANLEEQVQSSLESLSNSNNKDEIYAPKSYARRSKKKRM